MRRMIACLVVAASTTVLVQAADKDSPAAATTRKKLQAKMSCDFKEETFSEILKEVKKAIEDANLGALSTTNDAGVSNNTKYTFKTKDQTVAEVLDGLLKKNGVGYIVVSKPGDRYDGWLKFKQGNERGWVAGEEPKGKAPAKAATTEKAKDKEQDKAPATDAEKDEKSAALKLDIARELIRDGKKDRAKTRLDELIKAYPDTKAAADAKKELEKLKA